MPKGLGLWLLPAMQWSFRRVLLSHTNIYGLPVAWGCVIFFFLNIYLKLDVGFTKEGPGFYFKAEVF
jgi:hypothetical protein